MITQAADSCVEVEIRPHILVFSTSTISDIGIDLAGSIHLHYSPTVVSIPISCSSGIRPEWILFALNRGFDGVFIAADGTDCPFLADCTARTARIVGRTQEIVFMLDKMATAGALPGNRRTVPGALRAHGERCGNPVRRPDACHDTDGAETQNVKRGGRHQNHVSAGRRLGTATARRCGIDRSRAAAYVAAGAVSCGAAAEC